MEKKLFVLILIILFSLIHTTVICKAKPNSEKRYFLEGSDVPDDYSSLLFIQNQADTISNDSSVTIGPPKFYTDSHLLVGAEIIDPFHPNESLVTATRLWKTDIRLGISQTFKYGIVSFISIRDNDSPNTNAVNLFEAGIKINHNWGTLWFGQIRIQAGEKSYYLNDAFDRSFWDKGLIYDYLMRGIGASADLGIGKTELFIGSDKSSYFIGGGKYSIQLLEGLNAFASGLYIARDQQYSAFGTQLGLELEESFNHFFAYQVIGYNKFQQEPSPIKEYTVFTEASYLPENAWNFGASYFYKRVKDSWKSQNELRTSFDIRYKVTNYFRPELRMEIFKNAGFREIHLGFSAYLQYLKNIKIVPRIRYIITQFGSDIGYIGLEGNFSFGDKE